MENLNAEQVKKALEWCYAEATCSECPYQKICFEVSQWQIMKDALALINSQEQRIKELTEVNDILEKTCANLSEGMHNLRDNCEKLSIENERLYANRKDHFNRAQRNAILAMQERLNAWATVVLEPRTHLDYLAVPVSKIEKIAKEMLEDAD